VRKDKNGKVKTKNKIIKNIRKKLDKILLIKNIARQIKEEPNIYVRPFWLLFQNSFSQTY